jgi:hypothetical protein
MPIEPPHLKRRREKNPNKVEPTTMIKDTILKYLFSKMGQPIAAGVSFVAAYILQILVTTMAQYLEYHIPAEAQTKILESVTAACYALINVLLHKYAGDKAVQIQKAVGVDDDRWIGDVTVAAVEKHAEFAKKPEVIHDSDLTPIKTSSS